MKNTRGSEWNKWDLHIHTASSYDSPYKADETIYWQFDDIVEFCKNHGGLISIHAGKKSNGIDKEISNALPVKEAIKSDIAKHVDFFEVGKKKDIVDYYKYLKKYL